MSYRNPRYPVIFGIEAGRDGVMVRKSLGRKRRNHPLRPDAFTGKLIQCRRLKLLEIIVAKPVDRDQNTVGWRSFTGFWASDCRTMNIEIEKNKKIRNFFIDFYKQDKKLFLEFLTGFGFFVIFSCCWAFISDSARHWNW